MYNITIIVSRHARLWGNKVLRRDNGGKGVASSGNDEESGDGSTVCTCDEGLRRQGSKDGGGIQDAALRRRLEG